MFQNCPKCKISTGKEILTPLSGAAIYKLLWHIFLFILLLIPIFPYEFITDRNANTNQKHNCQNCEIHTITSHFFLLHNSNGQDDRNRIHRDNRKTTIKTGSIGEDSTLEIIEFPIAGIFERRSKVTKNRPLEYT